MPRELSIPFAMAGVLCMTIGFLAMVGGSLPLGTIAAWMAPLALVGLGVFGLMRVLRPPR